MNVTDEVCCGLISMSGQVHAHGVACHNPCVGTAGVAPGSRSIEDWGLLDRIIVASPLTARRRSSYLKDSDFVRYVELSVLDHSCDIAFVSVFGPATGERLGVRVILKANRRLVRDILIPT